MKNEEIHIPIMITSDQPSERMERELRRKLAKTCLNGKGNYKVRASSGCFNEFITNGRNK